MSSTFDFQGGGKDIRLRNIRSTADSVVKNGGLVRRLDVDGVDHDPSAPNSDPPFVPRDHRWQALATIAAVAGLPLTAAGVVVAIIAL